MRCRHAKKLIFDYIDGVISESDRIGLEHHLGECKACEANATSLARSLELLHRLPAETPSDNFNWKLRLKLARERSAWQDPAESERAWQRRWNTRFAAGVAAGFLVIAISGAALLSHDGGIPPVGDGGFAAGPNASAPSGSLRMPEEELAQDARTWIPGPFSLPPSGEIVSQPVTTGAARALGPAAGGPLINADSLMVRYMESRREALRIRQLEQQIDILHEELQRCRAGGQE